MKVIKWIFVVIIIIGLLALSFAWYSGFFATVEIIEKDMGPYELVYKKHIGDYSKSYIIQNEVYESLLADGIETERGFGIYYDNPKTVEITKLRSDLGCILNSENSKKIESFSSKYNIRIKEKSNCVVIEFPYINKLSIIAGVIKVYPAFGAYAAEKGIELGEAMEIYDITNKKITYLMVINK